MGQSPRLSLKKQTRAQAAPTSKNGCGSHAEAESLLGGQVEGAGFHLSMAVQGSPAPSQVAGRHPLPPGLRVLLGSPHPRMLVLPEHPPWPQPGMVSGASVPQPQWQGLCTPPAPAYHMHPRPLVSILEVLVEGCGFTEVKGSLRGKQPFTEVKGSL